MRAYLELLRPANVTTALADVLAGFAVAGLLDRGALAWLLASTACLYGGGVVLNDVFDADLDRVERPERPLPSGRVSLRAAAALGTVLLAAGVAAAAQANRVAFAIAAAIAILVVFYDAIGKRHDAIAPVTMGMCRALNLLLGVASTPAEVQHCWPIAVIPLTYIAAVTMLSRGEVHGGTRRPATAALVSLSFACAALMVIAARSVEHKTAALVLALAVVWRVMPPFWRARQTGSAADIRNAVRRGVLSLVLVDASIGAAFAGPLYAALILATGLIAGLLAQLFAVT